MTRARLRYPAGITARAVAGGRDGATRRELYAGPAQTYETWIGDLVRWQPENEWTWQPAGCLAPARPEDETVTAAGPDELMPVIAAALTRHTTERTS